MRESRGRWRWGWAGGLLCCVRCGDAATGTAPPAPAPDPSVGFSFTEEAAARGLVATNHCGHPTKKTYILETIGNGCALFDMDGDGDLDAFVTDAGGLVPPADPEDDWGHDRAGRCRLFENDGQGHFADVTEESGAGLSTFAQGVVAADYDGDADLDLFVTCWGRDHLLQNDGAGRFRDVTEQAKVGDDRWSVCAAFFDADGDEDLDLYVGNYVAMARARDPDCWKKVRCPYFDLEVACGPKGMIAEPDSFFANQGDGTFRDATAAAGFGAVEPRYAFCVVPFDLEQDGDLDLFVANDSRGNYLFENDGHGRFTEIADLAGCALSASGLSQAGMGTACGDYDGDLDLDLFLTTFSHDDKTLFQSDGQGSFLDVTTRHAFGTETWLSLGWGTEFADFDLDGDVDLFVANGHVHVEADQRAPELTYAQSNRVYANEGGRFRDATALAGTGMQRRASHRGAAFGDVDEDGDEDVLVTAMNAPCSLLVNGAIDRARGGASRRWLAVELEQPGKNRFAVGARVVAESGGRKMLRMVRSGGSFASASDFRLRFGLGDAEAVDRLTVTWPEGTTQVAERVAGGRTVRWRKGEAPSPRIP